MLLGHKAKGLDLGRQREVTNFHLRRDTFKAVRSKGNIQYLERMRSLRHWCMQWIAALGAQNEKPSTWVVCLVSCCVNFFHSPHFGKNILKL